VNRVRTVSSVKFICCCWRNPWCDFHVAHTCCDVVRPGACTTTL